MVIAEYARQRRLRWSRVMSKFLITGGCGFLGSHLSDRLLASGHEVRIPDDLSTGSAANVSGRCDIIHGDVADPLAVAEAVTGVDGCYHLAESFPDASGRSGFAEVRQSSLKGAINLFSSARRTGNRDAIPVVYASSSSVYGDNADITLTESDAVRPLTTSAVEKATVELQAPGCFTGGGSAHGGPAPVQHLRPTPKYQFPADQFRECVCT